MEDNLKMCSSCGVFQPPANFKRLLTRAQSKARGYAGVFKVEIESKLCKNCQPKPKPLHKLTKKELHNKVESGDVNKFLADSIIKERHATVNQRRAAKTSARWAEKQSDEWRKLVYGVSKEITMLRQQQKYANNIKDAPRQHYTSVYLDTLNKLRARLRFAALRPHGAPESIYWMEHLQQEEINHVREAWDKLSVEARARMKQPLALIHKPTLPEDSRPRLAFEYAQADGVTPDERLAHGIRLKMHPKDNTTTNPTSPEDWDDL